MRLQYGIAFNLVFIVCLSSFMLGMGTSGFFLPGLVFFAALASLYFADIKGTIRLNRWTSNALILLCVFLSFGYLSWNRTEALALGIARVLQLVQIVVLFQEKNSRNRWHLLLISFLQIVVASAFQQSLVFGLLLFVYVFANMSALTLMFLHEENAYFKQHSFARSLGLFQWSEFRERQSLSRLLKIILATFVVGPLSLILFYRESESRTGKGKDRPHDAKQRFLTTENFLPENVSGSHWETAASETKNDVGFWEDRRDAEESNSMSESILSSDALREEQTENRTTKPLRWPFLFSPAVFYGGTNRQTGLIGAQRELFLRLGNTAILSLVFGAALFLLIPRFGGFEIFGQRVVFERWAALERSGVGVASVGFTKEIQLGSVGNVIQNSEKTLSVRFLSQGIRESESREEIERRLQDPPVPYSEIEGKYFYLRGVTVERYLDGRWSHEDSRERFSPRERRYRNRERYLRFQADEIQKLFFEKSTELVTLEVETPKLDSPVLFTVWPFYLPANDENSVVLFTNRVEIPGEDFILRKEYENTFYTTAFQAGEQCELIPSERIRDEFEYLLISKTKLPSLVALAQKWDDESGLPKSDYYGRAKNLEQRLFLSEHFQYRLGGITRDLAIDPLEDFVDQHPQGHCEYFAGTLAMMLRAVNIPSRVCLGYKILAEEGNEGEYDVRQSDAHSWVEARIPRQSLADNLAGGEFASHWTNGGWLRLDPTPPIRNQNVVQRTISGFYSLQKRIQDFWRQNVLFMDEERQSEFVYQPLREYFQYFKQHLIQWEAWRQLGIFLKEHSQNLFQRIRSGDWQADIYALFLSLVVGCVLVYCSFRLGFLRLLSRFLPGYDRAEGRQLRQASVEFYLRLERMLAKTGIDRKSEETQRAFAGRAASLLVERFEKMTENPTQRNRAPLLQRNAVSLPPPGQSLGRIVDSYYRVRFGHESISKNDQDRIEEDLHRIKAYLAVCSKSDS